MNHENKELTRIPKSLSNSHNMEILDQFFHVGGTVLQDILIYASDSQNTNLFQDKWFDIYDFCEKMGYNRTRMQRKLTDQQKQVLFGTVAPIYLTNINGQLIEHPIETVFEAALYRLGTANMSIAYTMNGETKYKFVKFLDEFQIKDSFHKKKTRRLYNVVVSKEFENALYTDFNLLELKDYRKIPNRRGYRNFYIYLAKMIFIIKYKKNQGLQPIFTATVDQLAKLFEINITRNNDRKTKVKKILDSINEVLESTRFQYRFIKGPNDQWAYTIEFSFTEDVLEYFDEKLQGVLNSEFYEKMQIAYLRKVGIQNHELYRYLTQLKDKGTRLHEEFITWVHSREDEDIKMDLYLALSSSIR